MYFRVTTYGFDESRFDEFLVKADETLRDALKTIAGLESVHSCRIGEGQGMIVASYDSEASAAAAQPKIQALFGELAEFMTSPPEVKEGNAVWTM
ncbi:MAG TPA: hypothetical protein DF863_04385 [Gammaproteobacteria bacterium]|jgi:hypothetical protein|nr:hypothetical protein [Arenicellales bacterium]MDP7453304.1 hypothetical protein [Arenicellales bacterium]HCV20689.1 hypothetical protein [Gammaproteobacteria bacterium]HJP45211.1 hypothetical protein [Arenicellales bacterium]|tara:strand:+ start:239 stop:523 length:285 start_codon:yes stop_codon:yes gene_type:complete